MVKRKTKEGEETMQHSAEEYYHAREDSELLRRNIAKYASGKKVLEIGCGSGVLAKEAGLTAASVLAVDINPAAIAAAKKLTAGMKNVSIMQSDMFAKVKKNETFDVIICNPPYLPADKDDPDDMYTKALVGGRKGYEFVERFLDESRSFLASDGVILLLFSSLTRKNMVDKFVEAALYDAKQIDGMKFDFEQLFVYALRKKEWVRFFEERGITDIARVGKGRRGEVFSGYLKGKKVAMKVNLAGSAANSVIENEARFLKRLNAAGIGSRLVDAGKGFVVYEYIEGEIIEKFLSHCTQKDKDMVKGIFIDLLDMMSVMDGLGIRKEEMHHPWKHVIVRKLPSGKAKVQILDFERCRASDNARNITQCVQFVYHMRNQVVYKRVGLKLMDLKEMKKLLASYQEDKENVFRKIRKGIFS